MKSPGRQGDNVILIIVVIDSRNPNRIGRTGVSERCQRNQADKEKHDKAESSQHQYPTYPKTASIGKRRSPGVPLQRFFRGLLASEKVRLNWERPEGHLFHFYSHTALKHPETATTSDHREETINGS